MFVVSTVRIESGLCVDLNEFYSVYGLVIMSSTLSCFFGLYRNLIHLFE